MRFEKAVFGGAWSQFIYWHNDQSSVPGTHDTYLCMYVYYVCIYIFKLCMHLNYEEPRLREIRNKNHDNIHYKCKY